MLAVGALGTTTLSSVGTDNYLYQTSYQNGWSPWTRLGSTTDFFSQSARGPAVTSRGLKKVDVFYAALQDNDTWQASWLP
jgi:hypothetical protein